MTRRHPDLPQFVRLLSGAFLVLWAYSWWLHTGESPAVPVISLLTLGAGLAVMAIAACPHDEEVWARLDRVLFAVVMTVAIGWLAIESTTRPYTSDEVAVGQASASALLEGTNPYGRDLSPLLHQFAVPPRATTTLLDGSTVHTASYPALSFLPSVPVGALLGRGGHYAQTVTIIAWGATLVLLWRFLPIRARPLLPILASTSFFIALVSGGNTDFLFLPFLCVAFWRWHRYGARDERSAARWAGPVALGLACAVKQTPWLIAPLLVAGVALEAHQRGDRWPRIAARYTAVAAAAFLAPNLPFILAGPSAWLRGVLLPLGQPLIPYGQGLIQVMTAAGGGRAGPYTAASIAAEVAAVLAFIALHPRSRSFLPVIAVVPLALGTRSLANYFVVILPPLLVGVATVPWSPGRLPDRPRRWLAGSAAAAASVATVAAIIAIASSPPVRFTAVSARTGAGGNGQLVTRLEVRVRNVSPTAVHPSFVSLDGVEFLPGWRTVRGPADLDAGAEATYTLVSTDPRIAVSPGDTVAVAALVPQPASVAVSARAQAGPMSEQGSPLQ